MCSIFYLCKIFQTMPEPWRNSFESDPFWTHSFRILFIFKSSPYVDSIIVISSIGTEAIQGLPSPGNPYDLVASIPVSIPRAAAVTAVTNHTVPALLWLELKKDPVNLALFLPLITLGVHSPTIITDCLTQEIRKCTFIFSIKWKHLTRYTNSKMHLCIHN